MEDHLHATEIRASSSRQKGPRERRPKLHTYVLTGLLRCARCRRKMSSHPVRAEPYYRCRYAEEYAVANKVDHPRNIILRERDVLPALDEWISLQFAPGHREATIDRLHAAQRLSAPEPSDDSQAIIRDCDSKLTRYRGLLDSGAADSATVAGWITETEAHRKAATARLTAQHRVPQLSRTQITDLVRAAGNIADALRHAERPAKARMYAELGVRLDYHHAQRKVLVGIVPGQHIDGEKVVSEGGVGPIPHESHC